MDLRAELDASLSGAYRLERELGGGGMSRVFVAEELALGRKVVIKVLPPELAATVSIERFNREIRTTATLQHAHIVPVLTAGVVSERSGLPFYTMPYVDGESLRAELDGGRLLPLTKVIAILRDIAKALAYAHDHGVVHRDIKPANVLLTAGSAVVTDFGLAKALHDARSDESGLASISQPGAAVGTPTYMAPEQVANADGAPRVDRRADIYAFGVVAYEMLAGRPPFPDPGAREPARRADLQRALLRARPAVPSRLVALVMKCLETDPADRPQRAFPLVRVLDSVRDRPGWRRWPWIPAAATLVAIVGGSLLMRPRLAGRGVPGSIAVLPPVSPSGDTANAYFSEGVADALTSALSRVEGLRVTPRSSAFAAAASGADFRAIGRSLGVDALLRLQVRRDSTRIRINWELTSTDDGHLLLADTVGGDVRNVFAAQDSAAQVIASALRVRLAVSTEAAGAAGTRDADAYDLYLRGRHFWAADDQRKAIDYFGRAIARDSAYAAAWSGLADAWYLLAAHGFARSADAMPAAQAAALRAIRLDGSLAEAHVSLGNVARWWTYDRATAEREFRRALDFDPRYPEAHLAWAWLLMDRGSVDSALTEARAAVALDPLSQRMRSDLGHLLLLAGRTDQAVAQFRRMADFDSTNRTVLHLLGRALVASGDGDGERMLRRAGLDSAVVDIELARWGGAAFTPAQARAALARLAKAPAGRFVPAEAHAVLHLRAGEPGRAIEWLERGLRDRSLSPELKMLPEFAPLHADQRFQAILRAMGVGS